jgi:hypothetical protein
MIARRATPKAVINQSFTGGDFMNSSDFFITSIGRDPRAEAWAERFGYFWYNDREIFTWEKDDFDRAAEGFSATGINHVITFSCTHFRWSFRPWWDRINTTISQAVEAFHRCGIAVTEHHSSHLTFNPIDTVDQAFLERVLAKRKSSLSSWPGFLGYCNDDPVINGEKISTFRQIDGRTGRAARTTYHGYGMCFNNPAFRHAYVAYLDSVYATGIDGIMTDDVQYFALDSWQLPGHACACEHCRRIFKDDTGYDLPNSGEAWSNWHGEYESENFLAWIDFRVHSTERFHQFVADHYESKRLPLLRPNYVSAALTTNPTAYTLDTLPRLDWVFQENCFSHIIRYSWPSWAVEAAHRSMVGKRRGIPAMSTFYPDRDDTRLFSWALAMSWGHLYLGTDEGEDDVGNEALLRNFERRHYRAFDAPIRIADVGFYDSRQNRVKKHNASTSTIPDLFTWAQSCYFANIPFTIAQFEDLDSVDVSDMPPVIIISDLSVWDEAESHLFERYAQTGGVIVATGEKHPEWGAITPPSFPNLPIGVTSADRWRDNQSPTDAEPIDSRVWETQSGIADFIKTRIGNSWSCRFEGLPRGIIGTAFIAPKLPGIAVHLVDTRGCLQIDADRGVSHEDPIPDLGPVKLEGGRVTFRRDRCVPDGGPVASAFAADLGVDGTSLTVEPGTNGEEYVVHLAGLTLSRYALVEIVLGRQS